MLSGKYRILPKDNSFFADISLLYMKEREQFRELANYLGSAVQQSSSNLSPGDGVPQLEKDFNKRFSELRLFKRIASTKKVIDIRPVCVDFVENLRALGFNVTDEHKYAIIDSIAELDEFGLLDCAPVDIEESLEEVSLPELAGDNYLVLKEGLLIRFLRRTRYSGLHKLLVDGDRIHERIKEIEAEIKPLTYSEYFVY